MLDRISDRNIWLVYAAILLLGTAYGISLALTSLFLAANGFGKEAIGSLAAWFALGLVSFSLPMGTLIKRYSARVTLTASLLGYAIVVAAFPYLRSYAAVAGVRFLDGVCSVGIWVSCETILLSRADARNKAFVISLYGIAMAIGYVLGPLIARVEAAIVPISYAFVLAGAIAATTAGLVATRLDPDVPETHGEPSAEDPHAPRGVAEAPAKALSAFAIIARTRTSCFATFAYGYFQASVVLFLPLFLIESKGIARERTILIPAFFAAGMLLVSNFVARAGDRVGHLLAMRVLGCVGTAMVLGFVLLDRFAAMAAAVFIAGATLASISPLSLALQGVVVARRDYGRANSIYNAFYAAGMLLGPPVSSRLFARAGGEAMLYHLAGLWTAFVLFTVVFYRDDPAAVRARAALTP